SGVASPSTRNNLHGRKPPQKISIELLLTRSERKSSCSSLSKLRRFFVSVIAPATAKDIQMAFCQVALIPTRQCNAQIHISGAAARIRARTITPAVTNQQVARGILVLGAFASDRLFALANLRWLFGPLRS